MGLSGDLRTIDLPEVLQWIARGQQSGTLTVERGATRKWIYFKRGRIYSSASNDPREHLGQFLVRDGSVTEEELFTALLRQEQERLPLGNILVRDGKITQEALRRTLRTKAQEAIYDLFLWAEGVFGFEDGALPEQLAVHLDLDVTRVILEGARRADEWALIRSVIPSRRVTFTPTGRVVEDALETHAVALATAGRTFAAIAIELRRSDFEAATLLYHLVQRSVLTVSAPPGTDRPSDPVAAIAALLAQAGTARGEGRLEDAASALEAVLLLDRLNVQARKGLLALAEERDRARSAQEVSLEAIPRLARPLTDLTSESFDPLEGFLLSRVNGTWPVRAILKLCPVAESEARQAMGRLVERGVVVLTRTG